MVFYLGEGTGEEVRIYSYLFRMLRSRFMVYST